MKSNFLNCPGILHLIELWQRWDIQIDCLLEDFFYLKIGEGDNSLARLAWHIQDPTQVVFWLLRPAFPD